MARHAGMWGADTHRLRDVAQRFGAWGGVIEASGRRAADEGQAVEWLGPDADAFRTAVDATVRHASQRLAAVLADAEALLELQALAQEAASAAHGNGAGAPGANPGPADAQPVDTGAGATAPTYATLDATHREHLVAAIDEARASGPAGEARLRELDVLRGVLDTTPGATLVELDLTHPERVLAAVALGDLDTAANVTYVVPGINNTVGERMARLTETAANVRDQAALAGSGDLADYATVAWMGYDTGDVRTALGSANAVEGAARLERSLDAFTARRPDDSVELNLIGHSYGSTTAGVALGDGGQHGVDRFIAIGSAGLVPHGDANGWLPGGHEVDLHAYGDTGLWASNSPTDLVAGAGRLFSDRANPVDHGFTPFSSGRDGDLGPTVGHGVDSGVGIGPWTIGDGYLSPGTTSLHHVGRIVNGLDDRP